MDLSNLAEPPPPAEPLAKSQVSNMVPLTAGELRLSLDSRFIPNRVGSTGGTTTIALYGQLQPERMHPGGDFQQDELGTHLVMRRRRLARYRWLLSEISLEPPCVTVTVDRAAIAPTLAVPALATGEQCTFWLSTLGVEELAFENRGNPRLPEYKDYVEVTMWSQQQDQWGPWGTWLRARRVLASYDTASWEQKLALGETITCDVALGDHRLELLEVRWVSATAPAELHAHFQLSRGATADGMTKSPPPKPWSPPMPR